jgi:hypothetical protein
VPTVILSAKKAERDFCDAAYQTEQVAGSDATHLLVRSEPGKHRVEVMF